MSRKSGPCLSPLKTKTKTKTKKVGFCLLVIQYFTNDAVLVRVEGPKTPARPRLCPYAEVFSI